VPERTSARRGEEGTRRRLVVRAIRRAGWFVERAVDRFFEHRYAVRTSEWISLVDLGVDHPDRVWHDPCDWVAVRRALRRQRPGPEDVFVDFGSGLGRALLVAGAFPFRRVVGVELSDRLAGQARRNLERSARRMRAGTFDVVTADALEWEIPDEMTFAFLYSPFTGELFGRVLQRILASLERQPRVLRMVYDYPVEHNQVIGSGRAEAIDVVPRHFPPRVAGPSEVIVTYLLLPPAGRGAIPGCVPRGSRAIERHPEWKGPYDPGFVLNRPAATGLRTP
jgi:SAM-dependent methyltransferase